MDLYSKFQGIGTEFCSLGQLAPRLLPIFQPLLVPAQMQSVWNVTTI